MRVPIIYDASTDGSAEVARAIAERDARVEVSAHAINRGHIATYNEGLLEWADGDYTVLFSADDRLAAGALPRATRARSQPAGRLRLWASSPFPRRRAAAGA